MREEVRNLTEKEDSLTSMNTPVLIMSNISYWNMRQKYSKQSLWGNFNKNVIWNLKEYAYSISMEITKKNIYISGITTESSVT